jgi:TPR repeat protein
MIPDHQGGLANGRAEDRAAEAALWSAAEAGDADAANELGELLEKRGDMAGAELWFRRAAETGDVGAQHDVDAANATAQELLRRLV